MEKLFWNYSLGKSHFSCIKECFGKKTVLLGSLKIGLDSNPLTKALFAISRGLRQCDVNRLRKVQCIGNFCTGSVQSGSE